MTVRLIAPAVDSDTATRDRLLAVGTRLFAERGFAQVTVRDICAEASANVAAINYHFDGKTGLYLEVLRNAAGIMRGTTEEMIRAGEGLPPEDQLEIAVRTFLHRVTAHQDSWIHQLMMHEMREPTAGLDLVVEQVIGPRFAYMRAVVARLLACDDELDPRVIACATSVQSQLMVAMRNPVAIKLGIPTLTIDRVPEVARHIARFSVAGIRAIAAAAGLDAPRRRLAAGSKSQSRPRARRGLPAAD
jgi:TetR/AcrR family transcriptional regulator, regulator of cefoperazone and chloramphenicol sensitivity